MASYIDLFEQVDIFLGEGAGPVGATQSSAALLRTSEDHRRDHVGAAGQVYGPRKSVVVDVRYCHQTMANGQLCDTANAPAEMS